MAISIADAAASTSATAAIAHRARPLRYSFRPPRRRACRARRAPSALRPRRRFIIQPASSTIASTIHGHTR